MSRCDYCNILQITIYVDSNFWWFLHTQEEPVTFILTWVQMAKFIHTNIGRVTSYSLLCLNHDVKRIK